jgi:hypothetical protein
MNRNFQQMKNALYYPFQFVLPWGNVDMATNPGTNEIRPYNSSFNNSSAADVPRADGSTNPSTGFRLAYNTLSGANGNTARRGASKVVVFETDGVPNTSGTGTFTNGGPYNSYYANPGVGGGATFASAASQAVAIVDQIVALDSAANPGFSSTNTKALVYPCGFGHLFESSVPDTVTLKSQAMAFLLQVGQHGNTISASDTVNSPIITNGNGVTGPRFRVNFLITGTYQQRIDGLRLFFQGVMQAGVKVALIR